MVVALSKVVQPVLQILLEKQLFPREPVFRELEVGPTLVRPAPLLPVRLIVDVCASSVDVYIEWQCFEQLRAVLVDAGLAVDATPDALTVHDTSTDAVGDLAARHTLALHELSAQEVSLEQAYLSSTDDATVYRGSAG